MYPDKFNQHDSWVCPAEMTVPKSFFAYLKERGLELLKNLPIGKKDDDSSVVEMKIPRKEIMSCRCLRFYLKLHYTSQLNQNDMEHFKLDAFVTLISTLYFQQSKPHFKCDDLHYPDTIENVDMVSKMFLFYSYSIILFEFM